MAEPYKSRTTDKSPQANAVISHNPPYLQPKPGRWIFAVIILAGLAAGAGLFIVQAARSINAQQDIQYPESAVVFGVINLWRDSPLYHDYHQAPFAITSYTPIFYVISAAFAKLFAHSIHGVYLTARMVSLAATVGVGIVIAATVRLARGTMVAQVAAALIFFSSSLLLPWGYIARVDSLMLLFTALGLYLFFRWRDSDLQYLAIILFVLAVFTKQSALAAPAAAGLTLFIEHRRRRGSLFALGFIGLTTLSFLIIDHVTGGLLRLNAIEALDAPRRWRSVIEVWNLSFTGVLLPLALSAIVYFRLRPERRIPVAESKSDDNRHRFVKLFGLYLLAALALAAMSSSKLGSDRNYYLDALLAGSIMSGLAINELSNLTARSRLIGVAIATLILCLAYPNFQRNLATAMKNYDFLAEDNSALVARLQSLPGEALVQDSNAALRAGKEVMVTDSYHLAVLANRGRWQAAPLVTMIEQKRLEAIVLSFDIRTDDKPEWTTYQGLFIWPPEVIASINRNYHLAEQYGSYYLYLANK